MDPQTGEQIAPDPEVVLVIRQTYWAVSVRLLTKESKSESVLARLERSPDGVCQLIYVYSNTPRAEVRDRSELHYGAVVLNAPASESAGLEGHYFTDRGTRGSLRFETRLNELVETHHQAMGQRRFSPQATASGLREGDG